MPRAPTGLKRGYGKTKRLVKQAFGEVSRNVPRVVRRTARKKGALSARKQTIAIALSKARAKGASIRPSPGRGY